MKITEIAIKKSVGTALVTITVVILGIYSLPNIPVSFWPEFVAPTILVITPYPGAGPQEIEEQIIKPLEEELSTIDGVQEVESRCQDGVSRIMIRFDWGVDFEQAKLDVQERTNRAHSRFPREALDPKVLQIQDFIPPGIELGFTSGNRDLNEVRSFIETKLKNRFLRLSDVAVTQIFGGYESHIVIKADPQKLNAFGINLNQIALLISSENRDISAGKLETDFKNRLVKIQGKFQSVGQIKNLIIAVSNGRNVRLHEVAEVVYEPKEQLTISRVNGKEIVGLAIREKSGGNTVAMCDAVKEELSVIKNIIPDDIQMEIIRDQSLFIKRSIRNVLQNALIGAVLASIIILLFFGSLRNTLIIALSIPVSIITTFILINALGLSINTISLGGLALGIGLIVDSSIVVIENIYRHLQEKKKSRMENVLEATSEVGLAITSSTMTSIVVFLPLAFVVGLAAVLLGELALTVVFALTISIVAALTIVPSLSYKLMKTENGSNKYAYFSGLWQKLFDKIVEIYKPALAFCLRFRWLTLLFAALLLFVSVRFFIPLLDVVLLPSINEGEFRVELELPEGTRLDVTRLMTDQVEEYLIKHPAIKQTYTTIGQTPTVGEARSNRANIAVSMKADSAKNLSGFMDEIRQFCGQLPAVQVIVKQTTSAEGMDKAPVNIRVNGNDLDILAEIGDRVSQIVKNTHGTINLISTVSGGLPEYVLEIDHEKAADLKFSQSEIASALRQALLGSKVSRFSAYGEEYDITLKVDRVSLSSVKDLLNLPICSKKGEIIPLHTLVKINLGQGPAEIRRFNQTRVAEITADVAGRSSRETVAEIKARLAGLNMPGDYFLTYGGQSRAISDSFTSLLNALLIAIFLVYVVMGSQFNSFIHPFTIAVSIPLALIGVLLGLFMFDAAISTNAFLGTIMLVGIVVNNGILLIDYIEKLRKNGLKKTDAIIRGAAVRLRPIIITSLTTIFGMLPIALGFGEGGEALKPLGAVVVGGLTTSTFLTLFIIPVVYSLMDKLSKK